MFDSPWFVRLNSPESPRARLFAFTPAGSGAGAFRAWRPHLPRWVELVGVQLPGREARIGEAPLVRSRPVVDALEAAFRGARGTLPFSFFGHSVGGRIAVEWARRMEADGGRTPHDIVLAGATEPRSLSAADERAYAMNDDEIERYVGGFPPELRRFPRLLDPALRVLRADLEIFATDRPSPEPKLRTSIAVLGGRDDVLVTPAMLEAWRDWTKGQFELSWVDGDHFFPIEHAGEVAAFVVARLESALEGR